MPEEKVLTCKFDVSYAQRLKRFLDYETITPKMLAEEMGVHVSKVYRWLKGYYPSMEHLIWFSNRFLSPVHYILTGNGSDTKTEENWDYPSFSDQFRTVREKSKVSEEKLSKISGLSRSLFFGWIHGKKPRVASLMTLASALNMPLDELLGLE